MSLGLSLHAGLGGIPTPSGGGAPAAWTPASLSTAAKAWYDADAQAGADGATLSGITDTLGSFNATLSSGTGPVLRYNSQNSKKTVEFTSASLAKMTMSSSLLASATQGSYFAVFKLKNDPTLSSAGNGDVGAVLDGFSSDTGINRGSHHPYTDGNFYDHFGSSTRPTLGNPTPSFSSSHRLFNVEISSGGVKKARVDAADGGSPLYSATLTVDFGSGITRNLMWTQGNAVEFYTNGYLAEVLILDYVPNATDQAKIEGYLMWKWGLQANLPVGHTYASAAP